MKSSLTLVTILSVFASYSIVAMDYDQIWEGKTLHEWGESFVDIENTKKTKTAPILTLLRGLNPRLGEQSPVQTIDQAAIKEILRYVVQPTTQDFIYLQDSIGNIKVLHHNAQTVGEFKDHLREILGLSTSELLELEYDGFQAQDTDPLDPAMGGAPNSPYFIIRSH